MFESPAPTPAPPVDPPSAPAGLGRYVDFLLPAAAGTAVFAVGPLLLPGLFGPTSDENWNPRGADPVMWGLAAIAVAAVVYALIAVYRSF